MYNFGIFPCSHMSEMTVPNRPPEQIYLKINGSLLVELIYFVHCTVKCTMQCTVHYSVLCRLDILLGAT